jgi:hypothetical protein
MLTCASHVLTDINFQFQAENVKDRNKLQRLSEYADNIKTDLQEIGCRLHSWGSRYDPVTAMNRPVPLTTAIFLD